LDALVESGLADEEGNSVDVGLDVWHGAIGASAVKAEGVLFLVSMVIARSETARITYGIAVVGVSGSSADLGAGVCLSQAPGSCDYVSRAFFLKKKESKQISAANNKKNSLFCAGVTSPRLKPAGKV
jgi:hypothetical protein